MSEREKKDKPPGPVASEPPSSTKRDSGSMAAPTPPAPRPEADENDAPSDVELELYPSEEILADFDGDFDMDAVLAPLPDDDVDGASLSHDPESPTPTPFEYRLGGPDEPLIREKVLPAREPAKARKGGERGTLLERLRSSGGKQPRENGAKAKGSPDVLARINLKSVVATQVNRGRGAAPSVAAPSPPAPSAAPEPSPAAPEAPAQSRPRGDGRPARIPVMDPVEVPPEEFDTADWLTETRARLESSSDQVHAVDETEEAAAREFQDDSVETGRGFDHQETLPFKKERQQQLQRMLEKLSNPRSDLLRTRQPSAAPPPVDLNRETNRKIKQVKHLFEGFTVVLQTIHSTGTDLDARHPRVDMDQVAHYFAWLEELLGSGGELRLEISPYEILLDGHPVISSTASYNNPFYNLYYEGLRELRILPGITLAEFMALIRLLSWSPGPDAHTDVVTLLWENHFPHLRTLSSTFLCQDMADFPEGGFQATQQDLVLRLGTILHGDKSYTNPMSGRETDEAKVLRYMLQLRVELAHFLSKLSSQEAMDLLTGALRQEPPDRLRRTVHMVLALCMASGKPAAFAMALAQLAHGLFRDSRWDELLLLARTLEAITDASQPSDMQQHGHLLRRTLCRIFSREMQDALAPALASLTVPEFDLLQAFIKLLPDEANEHLPRLLDPIKDPQVQARLIGLLNLRGINMELMYTRRLLSDDEDEVIDSIEVLKNNLTSEAVDAIRCLLDGQRSPRVRLAALNALESTIEQSLVPDIVDCMQDNHDELREVCLVLLERLPAPPVAQALVSFLDAFAADTVDEGWTEDRRLRVLRILVRSGDQETRDLLVKHLCNRNILRAAPVEVLRKMMMLALEDVGGHKAKKIIQLCYDRWISAELRQKLDELMGRLMMRLDDSSEG